MSFLASLFRRREKFRYEGANAALVYAIHEVALKDNNESRKRLYEALLASTLIIPTPELPGEVRAPGERTAGSNIRIELVGFTDKQGLKITPAFTDVEALKVWDPNTPSLGIKAQALFQMVRTDFQALVINPFDPIRKMIRPGGRVTRSELELLAKGVIPTRTRPSGSQFQLSPNQKVAIGIPAIRPSAEVEELLRATAVATPEISDLYLFQMATSEWGSLTAIGIQVYGTVSPERENSLAVKLGETVQPKLQKGQSLDFLILRGDMGRNIRARGLLIFRRD